MFCWELNSLTRFFKQRVTIQVCDQNEEKQKFDYTDGKIHSRAESRLCAGYQQYSFSQEIALTFSDCYTNCLVNKETTSETFELISADNLLKPFPHENMCLFKRYGDYVQGNEVWMSNCAESQNDNPNKSGKYKFSFDSNSGLIKLLGSEINSQANPFCLKINSLTRFYKQRVKIARCDEMDVLQQFSYGESSGILSMENKVRLCAGFESSKIQCDQKLGRILVISAIFFLILS